MRSLVKMIFAAALALLTSATASAALTSTITVHVNEYAAGSYVGIGSVTVAAIQFGMNGPSTHTQVGLTNSAGYVTFYNIQLQSGYSIFVSSHEFSPTINEQFNDPNYNPNRHFWTHEPSHLYSTFTLTHNLTDVGQISQEFSSATANAVLMGGIYNMLAQMPGPSGMVRVNPDGTGVLRIENVPYAEANTYNIGLYDPAQERGIGRNVMSDLGDGVANGVFPGNPTISYNTAGGTLSFFQAIPPARVKPNTKPGGSGSSGVSVEGVVYEMSYPTATVNHTGLGIKACVGGNSWNGWANTDEKGRFQLYGLVPGATYYFNAMGGCTWSQDGQGACYGPHTSAQYSAQDICSVSNSSITINDLLYVSSDVAYHGIQLNRMPPSNGEVGIFVRSSSGYNIPNAHVNIHPDGTPWPLFPNSCDTPEDLAKFVNNPGFSQANAYTDPQGYARLTGLPSGNYNLNVWTPFSSGGNNSGYNAGADGTFTQWGMSGGGNWQMAHCNGTGSDDYRLSITTWTVPMFHIYDSSGTEIGDSTVTYVVSAGAGNSSGLLRGTVNFPSVVDLSNSPIMITMYPQCMGPCTYSGGLDIIDGSGQASYPYSINVSSGTQYWMNVTSPGWGRIQKGGNSVVNLKSTGTVILDMEFAPAGTVSGKLYKPDGTIFTPSANQWIHIGMNSDRGGSGARLQSDGSFSMNDVLTGEARAYVSASGGSFDYALPTPTPSVNVTAGSTSTLNINLVAAIKVGVLLDISKVPDATVVMDGWNALWGFRAIPVPAGTQLKGETIREMLFGKDNGDTRITYSAATTGGDQYGPCGQDWPGGFCARSVPAPAVYDFYLMRSGDFGGDGDGPQLAQPPYPHFTLLSSSRNVVVNDSLDNFLFPATGMERQPGVIHSTVVAVNLTPANSMAGDGNATLAGSLTAENFFRQADYDATNGDMEAFMDYLPLVTLYNADGSFKAAGIVIPPPSYIMADKDAFDVAYAQGYAQFKTLLDGAKYYGFEIRGLKPSTCYTAVVTTPNYPPYQTRSCTGVNGSTTTITVNMDSAVGRGATVTGVITSTATGLALANAAVELFSAGADARSAVTKANGEYTFRGLGAGIVRIKASLDGYSSGEAEADLVGANTYTRSLALFPASGSITGTVYSQKMPYAKAQAGAQIVAYNDTYNGTHPEAPLPLIRTRTGTDGTYRLNGLIPGDVYSVYLKVPGKYTLNVTTPATSGVLPGVDFTMLPKPLDIEIFARKGEEFYEFTVLNPQDFKQGEARWNTTPYSPAGSTELQLQQLASGEMYAKIPLSSLAAGITYTLRASATSYSLKNVTKEMLFGKDYKGNTSQQIDAAILGDDSDDGFGRKNNEVPLDRSGGDPSGIAFPPGAMLIASGAVPSCTLKGEDKDSDAVAGKVAALGADAFAGDLYTIDLASVSHNNNKSIEITLAYDKSTADLADLSVARYNDSTGKWDQVPGVATVNPLKGTVKVKLKTLASVLNVRPGAATPQVNHFDGRQYRVSAGGSGSSGGTFAVVRPSIAGNAYAGSKLKVFNYPNPFNLKTKTVNNSQGAALSGSTEGTVIHVEVPAGNGGNGHVRIYTLAGELVNDLRTNFTAGAHNYVLWNGNNKAGQSVANGVYYGVVELSGKKPDLKDATFKMVIIK